MKAFLTLFFAFLLFSGTVHSQDNCNCELALQKLVNKIETEYPGFSDKTKDKTLYDSLKESLIAESKKSDDSVCLSVLKKYISFFKDPHLSVSSKATNEVSNTPNSSESVEIDIQDFVEKSQTAADKFEGVWSNESYKIGIKKTNENEYVGFVIESKSPLWKPKEIKFRLAANGESEYFMQDHSSQKETYSLFDDCILRINGINAVFTKQLPKPAIDAKTLQSKLDEIEGFYFKKLTPKTSILKISSFNYPDLERVQKLIQASKPLIEKTENLIIDIRDNPGGTDTAYKELLPYIVTNPYRELMAEFLATQTFIDQLENYIKAIKEPEKHQDDIARMRKQIELLRANLGKFVSFKDPNKNPELVAVTKIKSARKSPKQIAVLTNKGVGSAAENFVYKVKQSKKVKILGTPTYGGLDYGNAFWTGFGCENYQVFLPTYRATRLPDYPIDNIGFQPDIYLDKSVTDWIKYAIDYLEN